MQKSVLSILLLLLFSSAYSQFSLSGKVFNAGGEDLEGASVFIVGSDELATITDHEGIYLLENIPFGKHTIKVTFVGYEGFTKEIDMTTDDLLDIKLADSNFQIDRIDVIANRLDESSAYSYTEMNTEEIQLKNLAQDIPFLVEHTPSMVVTSDAGAGVGYSGMRIRGSDATRINITINGVPLNDSESHGVFWVNLPDFSSSVDNLQIQRGVGPSTNGAGAFGGSVGLNTNYINQNPFVKADLSYGSFNTQKLSLSLSTGLINNSFIIEGRYSLIKSDGYIDRATSDLNSYYFSAGKIGKNYSLKLNLFSGKERTYQAWWGVPESKVNGDQEALMAHYLRNKGSIYNTPADSINLFDSGRNYNYYTYINEVDDYKQDHYQLLYTLQPSDKMKINLTGHYTRGKGFFEQFEYQDDFCDYIDCNPNISDGTTDLVVRRWLDNHFFGGIANAEYAVSNNLGLTLGGSANVYLGDHFGEVVDAINPIIRDTLSTISDWEYYRSDATKTEYNGYLKTDFAVSDKLKLFGDIQMKNIAYESEGLDNDRSAFAIDTSYLFINPKVGLSYFLQPSEMLYLSFATANREPVRGDFLDAVGVAVPSHETLYDVELGYKKSTDKLSLEANLYYMHYIDQLVLTGAVNDVGGPIRTNVDQSSRLGLELSAQYNFSEYLSWRPNLTLSRNKIAEFTEIIANYDTFINDETVFENSDIAYSPSIVAGSNLSYNIAEGFDVSWLAKFVGKQYLDNTSSDNKSMPAYLVNDLVASYKLDLDVIEDIEFKLVVNNFLNTNFSSNGYTYSYVFQGLVTENFLFPQAGINFLLGASIKF